VPALIRYECFLSCVECVAADGSTVTLCPMHALGEGCLDGPPRAESCERVNREL